jgi:hypothetical protein
MASALEVRLENVAGDCTELAKRVDAMETIQDDLSDRLYKQEYWRDGNGARGAEARLQDVEKAAAELPGIKADLAVVKLVADAKLEGIEGMFTKTLDARDKTVLAYIKAFGPWIPAIAAIGIAIIKVAK